MVPGSGKVVRRAGPIGLIMGQQAIRRERVVYSTAASPGGWAAVAPERAGSALQPCL